MKNNIHFQESSTSRLHGFLPFRLVVLTLLLLLPHTAHAAPITPFYTQNQSPLALIFGLPAAGAAAILAKGELTGTLAVDIANNFAANAKTGEAILLDGESCRVNLALRYGIAKGVEGG
ncbi:MAG: DUF3187 family protein, partial [Geobacteraceae bacterium]|nr:DUF3187 family protein [Geobacteraceae bacterium]